MSLDFAEVPKKELRNGIVGMDLYKRLFGGASVRCAFGV
jgi:hypothetical protein